MGNQNQNGRNVALPDENRPSWRPQDQTTRGRGGDDDRGRSWRDRDDREDDRMMMSDRDRGSSPWDDDRDEGPRMSDRYGQGQSGYAAGRQADDRSMHGYQNRNQGYAGGYEDRQHGVGLDDRFSGRGGQGYWQDRGSINQDRQFGGGRSEDDRSYHSGYNQGGARSSGAMGGSQQGGFGGHGMGDQGRGGGSWDAHGPEQGRTGGYAPQAGSYGGRSGQYGQGHQGMDQTGGYGPQSGPYGQQGGGYGPQGGGHGQDQQRQQRGQHRGKGPQGYQRSDERIREMVCEALTDDDQIDASTIEIAVKSGEVILSGTVPDRRTKRMAEDVVERCAGVKDVQNQIKVSVDQPSSRGAQAGNGSSGKNETETPSSPDKKHRA